MSKHADMGPCGRQVDDEELAAHRIILMARSPVFHALLNSEMREGVEGVVTIEDVRGPVFRALLHFVYTDCLPEVRLLTDSLSHASHSFRLHFVDTNFLPKVHLFSDF